MFKKNIYMVIKKLFKKNYYKMSSFDDYSEYIKIQYRCAPKEFLDSRLKIVSSFVFIFPILEKHNISIPIIHKKGIITGQLRENKISILDTGCRDGWVLDFLNSLGYTKVIGIELLQEYVDYCKERGRTVVFGDLHKIPFQDEHFDFVYCRHVLEHCLDPVLVLNELMRVAKNGGAVYCSFPLEGNIFGKHTTSIPNINSVHKILKEIKYKFDPLYIGMAENTSQVIPEGNEAIIFVIKKLQESRKMNINA